MVTCKLENQKPSFWTWLRVTAEIHTMVAMGRMGPSLLPNRLIALLGLLAASRSASALPWTVGFGACTFSGNTDGAPLVRSGSCPTQGGGLNLEFKGITSVPAEAFAGMTKME